MIIICLTCLFTFPHYCFLFFNICRLRKEKSTNTQVACAVCICMSKMSMSRKKTDKLIFLKFFKSMYWPLPLCKEYKIIPCKYEAKKENRICSDRVFFQYFEIQGCRRLMEMNSLTWFFSVR